MSASLLSAEERALSADSPLFNRGLFAAAVFEKDVNQ
jgi:hypothetical protein